jgi:uncharacterized protein with PIN domain
MDDRIRRYYETKNKCPRCNGRNFVNTEVSILEDIPPEHYIDRRNVTICKDCEWRGLIDDLRP